jgi:hypothetical protein
VYAPQFPTEYGGMGVDFRDALPAFEEAELEPLTRFGDPVGMWG